MGQYYGRIDLTRRLHGKQVFGLTMPLITKSDGSKFGEDGIRHRLAGCAQNIALCFLPVLVGHG